MDVVVLVPKTFFATESTENTEVCLCSSMPRGKPTNNDWIGSKQTYPIIIDMKRMIG